MLSLWLVFPFMTQAADKDKKLQKQINQVIKTAESYLGTPHRMGGMTHKGIDCSGLMVKSFAAAGITLPRRAVDQSKSGQAVNRKKLVKGDLVFFNIKGKVGHVGLVTEARGGSVTFIHTSSSRGVMKSRLEENYWDQRYVRARRIWKNADKLQLAPTLPPPIAQKPSPQPDRIARIRYPELSQEKLTRKQLKRLSRTELADRKNELLARQGFIFPESTLQAEYEKLSWYQAIPNKTHKKRKIHKRLSKLEKKNLQLLDKRLK